MQEKNRNLHTKSSSFQGAFNVKNNFNLNRKEAETSTSQSISSKTSSITSPTPKIKTSEIRSAKSKVSNTISARNKSLSNEVHVCKNCLNFMQNEVKMLDKISSLSEAVNSIIFSVKNWKNGKVSVPAKVELHEIVKSFDMESSQKFEELYKDVVCLSEIVYDLCQDVTILSQNESWECVKRKSTEENSTSDGVLGTISKAKDCIAALQSALVNDTSQVHSANSLVQSLSLQLAQSKRDRRVLEVQLLAEGKFLPEETTKLIDSLIAKTAIFK